MIKTLGYAAYKAKEALAPFTFERRDPRDHDVVIDIKYCGICHSDVHQARDEWGAGIFPMVPGHEIAGIVTQVGSAVTKYKVGDKVGVGCFVDSCRECEYCKQGLEQFCARGMTGTYNAIERDGKTISQGGYSGAIVVDENYVLRIPENLPLDAAAPLLCAGITLYSPLAHWKAGPGKKVAIVGLGGLGHMGVKLAHAMGAEVTVLSQSLRKQGDGKRLGADHFYATSDAATFKKLAGSFDLIINTVSAPIDWNAYLGLLKVDGALVVVGVPEEQVPVGAFSLIMGRRSLAGSLIGGIQETQEMLDFCGKHNITSDIETIAIQGVNEAYDRVVASDVRYRFVINMPSLETAVAAFLTYAQKRDAGGGLAARFIFLKLNLCPQRPAPVAGAPTARYADVHSWGVQALGLQAVIPCMLV
ncbi:NAD(P)-dependent alcohol dehydrogenase [Azospirillum sp. B4]|uniref:NAD(P)-dependent alcohol dehydrogenase n=1 Tax=Azospirillum sp. B4 TaxID=95605 RepID=UPI00034BEE4C|nr:NAD(P)-dependent alcohol dehydrogenase [Azospirillum sp. B4]